MGKRFGCLIVAMFAVGCSQDPGNNAKNNGGENNGDNNWVNNGAGDAGNNGGSNNGAGDLGAGVDADEDDLGTPTGCVPSRESWDTNVAGFVDVYCSNCHTSPPQFGAPFPLDDYDALVAGEPGQRRVDTMLGVLMAREMPPPASAQPDHIALDTMVEWASCGAQHPDHTDGLDASAPVHTAPVDPPDDTETFDVLADEYRVGPTTLDDFRCFAVEMPITEPRLVRRIEPVIDDGRVLHHVVVAISHSPLDQSSFSCPTIPPGDAMVWAWGPGMGAMQFPDGGLRIEPGDSFVLQIHYNNGAGAEDVADSSGFRVFHAPIGGTEWSMSTTGSTNINVPDGMTVTTQGECTVSQDVRLFTTWPHMHEIGDAFSQKVHRADGSVDTTVDLTGWHFEAQLLYDTPMELKQGDRIVTKCTYTNDSGRNVRFGTGTSDEMCFGFLYTTAPVCDALTIF